MSIDKNKADDTIIDFESLKLEGIGYIEKLAGKVWTDFNEHDPGITILEQLSFALTDLGYRASLPIQDIFASSPSEEAGNDRQLFYLLSDVMNSNPMTINDIRKSIIDIDGIKNAWVSIASGISVGKHPVSGLYNIHLSINGLDQQDSFQSRAGALKTQVREKLLKFRNLCEDVNDITVLTRQDIWLKNTEIELEQDAEPEIVLAKVYLELDKYLSQNVQFYSLEDLLAKGMSVNDIYEGPLLERGFILDQFLTDKIKTVTYSKLINIISKVDGVKSLKRFSIKTDKQQKGSFDIPADKTPFIVLPNEDTAGDLIVYKNNIKLNIKTPKIKQAFLDQKAKERRKYDLNSREHQLFSIPEGTYQDLGKYYSIQNYFPSNYRLGRKEPNWLADNKEIAKIRQLKGYLAIFEQFLADYMAQLENLPSLFSADETVDRTYFYQLLNNKNIPGIENILKNADDTDSIKDDFFDINVSRTYPNSTYESGLSQLYKTHDNFSKRRNQFLDHLLARFGDKFLKYYAEDFNYNYEDDEFQQFEIKNKCQYLQNFIQISKDRGKGYDYTQDQKSNPDGTGLDMRLQLLLGFNYLDHPYSYGTRYMAEAVLNEKIWFKRHADDPEASAYHIYSNYIYPLFIEFDLSGIDDTFKPLAQIEKQFSQWTKYRKARSKKFNIESEEEHYSFREYPDSFHEIVIDEDLLEHGSLKKNYYIGRTNPGNYLKRDDNAYIAVFYNQKTNKMRKLGEFKTQFHALKAVQWLYKHIKKLNIFSEGYHITEHLLLRPLPEEGGAILTDVDKYQIEITDRFASTVYFKGAMYFDIEQAHHYKHHAFDIITSGCLYVNYFTAQNKDGKYYIELRNIHSQLIATCPDLFDNLPAAITYYLTLVHFCQSIVATHEHNKEHYIRYERIRDFSLFLPDNFYSFQVSVVLPDWPARFKDPEFILLLKQTFRDNIPAHIYIHFVMLSPFQMLRFERAHKQWLAYKADAKMSAKKINLAAFEVTELLLRYSWPKHHSHPN